MGFSSTSDYWNQVTQNKKYWASPWNKITPTAMTAGRWYDEFLASGESGAGYHGNYVRNSGFDSIAGWTGNGAGGWLMPSQSRQENFSRTVWITFHCRGIDSRVRVTSSPSLRSRPPPQHSHALGGSITTRSLGR